MDHWNDWLRVLSGVTGKLCQGVDRGSAIGIVMRNMVTGREGPFSLMNDCPFSPSKVLELHRSSNSIETVFRDLKQGIDWRPVTCSKALGHKR